jgi:hypothetical protein
VTYYDVVLQRSTWPVELSDLREAFPAFPELVGSDPHDWRRLVDGARRFLESRLESSGWYADLLRNPQLAKQYIISKALERYFGSQPMRYDKELVYWQGEVQTAWNMISDYYLAAAAEDDDLEIAFG